jgi:hypothetical protein
MAEKKKRVTVFLDSATVTAAKIISAEKQKTVSDYIKTLINKDAGTTSVKQALKKRINDLGGDIR